MAKTNTNYSASSVKVLHGLEGIRERFDMYIGSKEGGVNHLVKEAIDNAVDEFLNGYATFVKVSINTKENSITITDNGRGMPIDMHPTEKKPTLEVLFTNIHAGAKFNDKTAFKVSSGRNGVGIKAISALSEILKVTSKTTKEFYGSIDGIGKMEFSKGKIKTPFKKTSNKDLKHGTIVEFIPDTEIFGEFSALNPELIRTNLEQRTYSNKGLKAIFEVDGKKETFIHKDGIKEYMEFLTKGISNVSEPYSYEFENNGNFYEVLFKYSNTDTENFHSFVNGLKVGGGTQETGFKMSLSNTLNKYIKDKNLLLKGVKEIKPDDIRKGLFCIINIKHTHPDFKSQTKDELTNPEIQGIMMKETNQALNEWIDKDEKIVRAVCTRIVKFAKARINTDDYIKKNIIKTTSTGIEYSKKFVDCATTDPNKKRVYIAEGDSAANNLIYCRDPEYMAVFGLKGKPLNIYGVENKKILENAELNELTLIMFGSNNPKEWVIENIKSKYLIITSDADIDGEHIRCICVNDIWRICPDIIKNGYVYICLTPKYRAVINGKNVFFQDDAELNQYRYNTIKKDIKMSKHTKLTLKKVIDVSDEFMSDAKLIIGKYSVHEDVFETVLGTIEGVEVLKDIFTIDKKTKRMQGFYEDHWHSFDYKAFYNEINELRNKYELPYSFDCTINGEEEEMTVYGLVKYINDNYKIKLSYLKGLGENSPEEFAEFMNPETERLIQIKCNSEEELEEMLSKFFGNKTNPRKEFVIETLC